MLSDSSCQFEDTSIDDEAVKRYDPVTSPVTGNVTVSLTVVVTLSPCAECGPYNSFNTH